MPTVRLLFLIALFLCSHARMFADFVHYPPGCDTVILTDGEMRLVHIRWRGKQEIHYTECGHNSADVFALAKSEIREIKPYVKPREKLAPSSAYKSRPFQTDTFDLLSLENGKKYRVVILERDYLNTYYRLYDDPADDRQYVVPNREVRSVRMAASHQKRVSKQGTRTGAVIILAVVILLIVL